MPVKGELQLEVGRSLDHPAATCRKGPKADEAPHIRDLKSGAGPEIKPAPCFAALVMLRLRHLAFKDEIPIFSMHHVEQVQ